MPLADAGLLGKVDEAEAAAHPAAAEGLRLCGELVVGRRGRARARRPARAAPGAAQAALRSYVELAPAADRDAALAAAAAISSSVKCCMSI